MKNSKQNRFAVQFAQFFKKEMSKNENIGKKLSLSLITKRKILVFVAMTECV